MTEQMKRFDILCDIAERRGRTQLNHNHNKSEEHSGPGVGELVVHLRVGEIAGNAMGHIGDGHSDWNGSTANKYMHPREYYEWVLDSLSVSAKDSVKRVIVVGSTVHGEKHDHVNSIEYRDDVVKFFRQRGYDVQTVRTYYFTTNRTSLVYHIIPGMSVTHCIKLLYTPFAR